MSVALGVIGAGSIASVHLTNADEMTDVDVRAVADVDEDQARAAAEPRNATTYTDGEELVAEADVDAVLVAVPPFAHPTYERAAVNAGLDVLVEKPVGLSLETVAGTRETIATSDVVVAAGYVCRYADVTEWLCDHLADRTLVSVETTYCAPLPEAEWWHRKENSGGQLVEQSTHAYDLHRYLAGEVESVIGTGTTRLHEDAIDFPDTSSVTLTHESGVVSHVGSTCAATEFELRTRIVAEDLRLTVDYFAHEMNGTVDSEPVHYEGAGDWYRRELRTFLDVVQGDSPDRIKSDYADAAETLGLTLAATDVIDSTDSPTTDSPV